MIALVWGVADLTARRPRARRAAIAATAAALVACATLTVRQVARWRDTRTLFTWTLAVSPDNAVAHESLGNALLEAHDVAGAIPHLERAAELAPDYPGALNNLGSALGLAGRNDEAVQVFERALREHESADAHFNLAYVEVKLGRLDDAIRECEAGLRLDPGHYESNAQLGMLLAWRGRLDEAIEHLRRALAARPANLETRRLLAQTLERAHRHDEAQAEYAEILHRSPGDRDAQSHLDRRTNP